MSSYQFHYLNRERGLTCLMMVLCACDSDARSLAASLPGISHRSIEIWNGERLVFEGFNPRILN